MPRYPTMPGRLKAKRAPIMRFQGEWQDEALQIIRLKTPDETGKEVKILGEGTDATPQIIQILKELRFIDS